MGHGTLLLPDQIERISTGCQSTKIESNNSQKNIQKSTMRLSLVRTQSKYKQPALSATRSAPFKSPFITEPLLPAAPLFFMSSSIVFFLFLL